MNSVFPAVHSVYSDPNRVFVFLSGVGMTGDLRLTLQMPEATRHSNGTQTLVRLKARSHSAHSLSKQQMCAWKYLEKFYIARRRRQCAVPDILMACCNTASVCELALLWTDADSSSAHILDTHTHTPLWSSANQTDTASRGPSPYEKPSEPALQSFFVLCMMSNF